MASMKPTRMAGSLNKLRKEAGLLKFAFLNKNTPWYMKACLALSVAYLVSPIDIIPDVIPFAGILDDLVLIPLGLTGVQKLIPASVRAEYLKELEWKKKKKRLPWLFLTLAIAITCVLLVMWM